MLQSKSLASLDPGDLSNSVPFIRRLKRGGEQRGFRDGLRCELGVDAGGSKEKELLGTKFVGGEDDIGLDEKINSDEIGGVGGVGENAADLGGSEEDEMGAVDGEEGLDIGLAGEIEGGVGSEEKVGEAESVEAAGDGGADEALVAGDEDRCGLVGEEGGA